MIARRGPRTRLPDARSRAGLDGAAPPLRRREGRRDSAAAPRGRRASPHQPAPEHVVARPRRAKSPDPTAARAAAPDAAGLIPHAAALAHPGLPWETSDSPSLEVARREVWARGG